MKKLIKPLLISFFTYLLVFYPILNKDVVIYSGKDSSTYHYPSRVYLYEKLKSGEFPFWSERLLLGFPLYADLERGYMNPINLLIVYLLGPFASYKLMHFFTYLLGSLSLFYLLKKLGHTLQAYIVANLIYFFSTFILYHQQHFNTVQILYLVPLMILLTKLFFETKNKKYILFNSVLISYFFYLGSMQFVLLSLITQLFWIFAYSKFTKKILSYLFLQYFIIFALILPGLVSVYSLFQSSVRSIESQIYTQGSFSPIMLSNLVIPFLFGRGNHYMGVLLNREYFIHEIYIYTGITTFIISLIYYLTTKNKQLVIFANISFVFFIVMSLIKYVPLLNNYLTFPFSFFRYWVRSVSLLNFIFAIFVSEFFSAKSFKFIIQIKRVVNIVYLLVFLVLIELINLKNGKVITFFKILLRQDYKPDHMLFLWFFILVLTLCVLILFKLKKIDLVKLKTALICLIVLDTYLFGAAIMRTSYRNIAQIIPKKDFITSKNTRIIDFSNNINGDNSLYFDSWSPFGYSVFVPKHLDKNLKTLGFKDTRYLELVDIHPYNIDLIKAADIGITSVITSTNTFYTKTYFPIKNKLNDVNILKISEQKYLLSANTSADESVQTYLTYNDDWKVFIDGIQTKTSDINGFLNFNLSAGNHIVRLEFVPTRLYISLLASIILIFISILLVKKINVQ